MSNFQINTYASIKNPQVVSTLSTNDWFKQIRNSEYSELIHKARIGEADYDNTKASLPCVTFNFLYDKYKKDINIQSSSGLMYIDIDNPSFDIDSIDKNKVYSYYHSFGGHGYAILVKVSGVTLDNFSSTYHHVTNELGIAEYIDIQAAKASQFNILSYDENIFINSDAYTFSSTNSTHSKVSKKKEAYTIEGVEEFKPLRFDNLDEIPIEGDYVVNWDGYEYIKCFLPMKKITSKRNNFLLSYCNNLVYLNRFITKDKTYETLSNVNRIVCDEPVDGKQLWRVVNSVHKYHDEGTLEPIYFRKKRKIVFDKRSKLTREEKLEICRAENAKRKMALSEQKLFDIIECWNFGKFGKITQSKVYKHFPISKKTVEKYWRLFKVLVASLNAAYKF